MNWFSDLIKPSKACLWESYVDTCIYAYNTSRRESPLFTPFELMFVRKAVIPVDLDNGSEYAQPDTEEVFGQGCDPDTIQKMQEDTKKRLEKAKVNIIYAQQKQKEVKDRKHHQPDVHAVGALVLKKDFTRKKRKGGKLYFKWVGPYNIHKSCSSIIQSNLDYPNPRLSELEIQRNCRVKVHIVTT